MNTRESVIREALSEIDWDRYFSFVRAVHEDVGLNRADLRFAKGRLLQVAFDNISRFNVERDGDCHNFVVPTEDGLGRLLVRFDQDLTARTPKTQVLCTQDVKIVLKNRLSDGHIPTFDDFDAVLVVGKDIAFSVRSSAIQKGSGYINKTVHQYTLEHISRFDEEVLTFKDESNLEKHFDTNLSQQLDLLLYKISQEV